MSAYRLQAGGKARGGLDPAVVPPTAPALTTPGRRWRFRRNLTIAVAHRAGLSQRLLADVFDLPRSRIAAIVAEVRALAAAPEG